VSYYREQLESWLKELDVKADVVLDIGGKQGNVKSRVKSWDVKEYEIRDLPEYDLQTRNPNVWSHKKNADVIFCLEVFEYIFNPIAALVNIKKVMAEGGRAYITFAFVYPHHNELEADSLRYTESGIKNMAKLAGLKIANIWYRTDRSGLLKAMYSADGMKMAKQYGHHNATGFIVELSK